MSGESEDFEETLHKMPDEASEFTLSEAWCDDEEEAKQSPFLRALIRAANPDPDDLDAFLSTAYPEPGSKRKRLNSRIHRLFEPVDLIKAYADAASVPAMLTGDAGFAARIIRRGEGDDSDDRKARRALLESAMRNNEKPCLFASSQMIQKLRQIDADMPHFQEVTSLVLSRVMLARATRTPIRLPPLLLDGGPGIGKSRWSRLVAESLGSDPHFISMNTAIEARVNLTGLGPAWRHSRAGMVARALIGGRTASPVIVLDELDKCANTGSNVSSPTDFLLSLLEPENAKRFVDEYVEAPIDASAIIWIATANDASLLPAPLLDRLQVIGIAGPDKEAMLVMARSIFDEANKAVRGYFSITDETLSFLACLTPRAVRKAVETGMAACVERGARTVERRDVEADRTCAIPKFKLGFLPIREISAR